MAMHVTLVSEKLLERNRTSLFDALLDVALISIFTYEMFILYISVNRVMHVYDWPSENLHMRI